MPFPQFLNVKNPALIAGLVAVTLVSLTALFFAFAQSSPDVIEEVDDDEDDEVTPAGDPDPLDAYKTSVETPAGPSKDAKKVANLDTKEQKVAKDKTPTLLQRAKSIISEGVAKHKKEDYEGAIELYGKAIQIGTSSGGRVDDLKTMYYNRAVSFLKMGSHDKAEADLSKAISMDAKYDKARKRRAAVRIEMGKREEALTDLYLAMVQAQMKGEQAFEAQGQLESLVKFVSASRAKEAWNKRQERLAAGQESLTWPPNYLMRRLLAQQQSSTDDATCHMKEVATANGEVVVTVVCDEKSSIPRTTAAMTLARAKSPDTGVDETISKKVALLLYLRAKAHVRDCSWDKAIDDLEESVATSTTVHVHAAALNELATLYYQKGDIEKSYGLLLKSLEHAPRCTNTLVKTAIYHTDKGNTADAKAIYDDIEAKEGKCLDVTFHHGLLCFLQDDFEKAYGFFDECIAMNPTSASSHIQKGAALYHMTATCKDEATQKQKLKETEEAFTAAAKHDPTVPDVHSMMGEMSKVRGDMDMQRLQAAFQMNDIPTVQAVQEEIHAHHKKAMAHFEKALSIDPEYSDAQVSMAMLQAQQTQDLDELIKKLQNIIKKDDQCQQAYQNLMQVYLQKRNVNEIQKCKDSMLKIARSEKEMEQVIAQHLMQIDLNIAAMEECPEVFR